MSWDADLECSHGALLGDWNYTHNTNRMIAAAMESTGVEVAQCDGPLGKLIGAAWWKSLDGKTGAEGHFLLRRIVDALEADPPRFRAMNPANGWGDYDSLVKVLTDMRDRCAKEEAGTRWTVSG